MEQFKRNSPAYKVKPQNKRLPMMTMRLIQEDALDKILQTRNIAKMTEKKGDLNDD
jgi:hypothetical protein